VTVRGKVPSGSAAPIPSGIDVGPGASGRAGATAGGSPTAGELAHPLRATSAATATTGTRPNTGTSEEGLPKSGRTIVNQEAPTARL
jgi:hypothetical protein